MNLLQIIIYFILLVGVLIFIHELGHFLFAKAFDVKVHKFSLGFGPTAWGFRRGETEYAVAWIPLGGFVKMLGEGFHEAIAPEDEGRAFHQKPIWQRTLIIVAGPLFNLIFPVFIYMVFIGSQTSLDPAVVGKAFAGQPAATAGIEAGDRIVAIDGKRVRYWEDLQRLIANHPGTPLEIELIRNGRRIKKTVTPKLHHIPTRLGLNKSVGLIGISPYLDLSQIGISGPETPAARAGLRTGDIVTRVNNLPVTSWPELRNALRNAEGGDIALTFVRPGDSVSTFFDLRLLNPRTAIIQRETSDENDGRVSDLGIRSAELFVQSVAEGSPAAKIGLKVGDQIAALDGEPLSDWDLLAIRLESAGTSDQAHRLRWNAYGKGILEKPFKLEKVTVVDEYKQEHEEYIFGAQNRLIRRKADKVPIEGRFQYTIGEAIRRTWEVVSLTGLAFVQLIRGAIPADNIGGVIILAHTARVAAEKGWEHFLWMMALISINLGFFNLLPVPILDGGHLVFLAAEALRRRPVSIRVREIASYVGLFLLLSLMVLAIRNDIVRLWFK